jgi:agmatinase
MNKKKIKAIVDQNKQHKIALIGIPYDLNSSYMLGSAEAPPVIRKALFSDSSNLWTETGADLGAESVLLDVGDLKFDEEGDPLQEIENSIAFLLDCKMLPIALGGDHTITYPIVKAFRRKYKKMSILLFDAHPDLYHEFQGNRYSHACTFARILESQLIDRLIQVGIRAMNGHQRAQAERFGVEVIEMRNWNEEIPLSFDSPVYISFDLDALDPSYAPGVSHREPGGLSVRQVISTLQTLKGQVVGADIVEFNPQNDPFKLTARVCAKLLKEIAALLVGR